MFETGGRLASRGLRWTDMERAYQYISTYAPYEMSGDSESLLKKLFWARILCALGERDVAPQQLSFADVWDEIDRSIDDCGGNVEAISLRDLLFRPGSTAAFEMMAKKRADQRQRGGLFGGKLYDHGTDGAATYLPLHFAASFARQGRPPRWGILIAEEGVLNLAADLYSQLPSTGRELQLKAVEIAFQVLMRHELFHFKVEQWALVLELAGGRPAYVPYMDRVYAPTYLTDQCLEEALANRGVIESRKMGALDRDHASLWMTGITTTHFDRQGPGYRNYGFNYWSPLGGGASKYRDVVNYLCNQIVWRKRAVRQSESVPFYIYPPNNNFIRAEDLVPIHFVRSLPRDESFIQSGDGVLRAVGPPEASWRRKTAGAHRRRAGRSESGMNS